MKMSSRGVFQTDKKKISFPSNSKNVDICQFTNSKKTDSVESVHRVKVRCYLAQLRLRCYFDDVLFLIADNVDLQVRYGCVVLYISVTVTELFSFFRQSALGQ